MESKCKCTMAISLCGDGCRYCQPQEYINRLVAQYEENEAEYKAALIKARDAIELCREKLLIECGGSREYKGGCPTQVLFPRIDQALTAINEVLS